MQTNTFHRFIRSHDSGEKGFSVVELLIILILLGLLSVIIVPNAKTYLGEPGLSAANDEALNVKAASLFFLHNTGEYALSSNELFSGNVTYVAAPPDGVYVFDTRNGMIISALACDDPGNTNPDGGITAKLTWNEAKQRWERK